MKTLKKIGEILVILLVSSFIGCGSDQAQIYVEDGNADTSSDGTPGPKNEKAEEVIANFIDFLDENEISEGAIAISFEGKLIEAEGMGRTEYDNAPVASLSKAITAVCIVKALEKNNLELPITLEEIMPETLADANASEAMKKVTVEQLLLHTSGIQGAHISELGPDITTMYEEQKFWQFEYIARQDLSVEPGMQYFYANANYLILGMAIESITNEDYEQWCIQEVLAPIGIENARISPYWTIFTSYAGWEISAVDYLTFIDAYYKPNNMVGLDPKTTTVFEPIDEQRRYGLGTLYRLISTGAIFWHSGSFQWKSEEQSGRFGAYYFVLPNGFSAAVNLSENLDDSRGDDIDRILYQLAQ